MQLPPEMYANYINRRQDDCQLLSQAIKNADFSVFKKIAHQLKGNASSFGFDELLQLASRMSLIDANTISQDGPLIVQDLESWIKTKKNSIK